MLQQAKIIDGELVLLRSDELAVAQDVDGSQMSQISSSSDVATTTAAPSSAAFLIRPWISFRADVDALRRLVEQNHSRLEAQPLTKHDLLLIPTREVHQRPCRIGRPHVQPAKPRRYLRELALSPNRAESW